MDEDNFDIDAIDATFIGLGSYLNEKDQIFNQKLEDSIQNDEFESSEKVNTIQQIPRKKPLRMFEQYVQDSINKLKKK